MVAVLFEFYTQSFVGTCIIVCKRVDWMYFKITNTYFAFSNPLNNREIYCKIHMILLCNYIFDFVQRFNPDSNFPAFWFMFHLEIILQHSIFLFNIFSLEISARCCFGFMIKMNRSREMTIETHCISFFQLNLSRIPDLKWKKLCYSSL